MDHLADAPIANILILAGVIFLAVGLFGRVGGFIGSIFGNIEAGKNSRVMAGVLGAFLIVGGAWLHEESHKSVATNPSPAATASGTSPAGTASPSVTPAVTPDSQPEVPKAKASTSQPSPKKSPPVVAPKPAAPALATPARAAERENLPPTNPPPVVDDRFVGTWTNLTPHSDGIKMMEVVRVGQNLSVHLWYSCPSRDCDHGIHRLDVSGDTSTYDDSDSSKRRVGHLTLQTPAVLLLAIDLADPAMQHRRRNNWVLVKSTLSDKMQSAFARYLSAPSPKAFAMAPGGTWSYHLGGNSADDAVQKALVHCEERGVSGCRIILLNDDPAH